MSTSYAKISGRSPSTPFSNVFVGRDNPVKLKLRHEKTLRDIVKSKIKHKGFASYQIKTGDAHHFYKIISTEKIADGNIIKRLKRNKKYGVERIFVIQLFFNT